MEEELLQALGLIQMVAIEKQIIAEDDVTQSSELTKSFVANELIRFMKGGITAKELVKNICEF